MPRDTERYRNATFNAVDRDDLTTAAEALRQVAAGGRTFYGNDTLRGLANTLDHIGRTWDEDANGEFVMPGAHRAVAS